MIVHLCPGEEVGKVRLNMWIFAGEADEYAFLLIF